MSFASCRSFSTSCCRERHGVDRAGPDQRWVALLRKMWFSALTKLSLPLETKEGVREILRFVGAEIVESV